LKIIKAIGQRVGDEMHRVAQGGQFFAELGSHHAAAAISGIAGNSDAHRLMHHLWFKGFNLVASGPFGFVQGRIGFVYKVAGGIRVFRQGSAANAHGYFAARLNFLVLKVGLFHGNTNTFGQHMSAFLIFGRHDNGKFFATVTGHNVVFADGIFQNSGYFT